ncbi:phosphohistidine phosphatase [Maribacter vaceletii]|uniref:Phosphohistidine phosphatase n=1 Tax=Maribacter vaceletii TaxID=1206816 RepID=A0A495DTW2_9FLAO|nr:histidine phosphatase family protein [Maribacter vaceletii]RKR08095.1 phosphohistidine phosphatase [Maribacter vaceletii]
MKNLILVRHGKSSWEYNVKDKDRPLKERGINDAFLVAEVLRKQQLNIDYVFSSPANRALHTSMIFCRELKHDFSNFQISNELYDFSGESVLSFVKTIDNNLNTIVIFGHNYAFTHIANSLGNNYIENVPTSGLVHLQFNEDKWSSVTKGITKQVIFPKQLRV